MAQPIFITFHFVHLICSHTQKISQLHSETVLCSNCDISARRFLCREPSLCGSPMETTGKSKKIW
ncbi:hypothetical protein GALMADRAFT_252750 [Galerina marginata CBS 339.88]|uniref:Uncharacterized protein n=1 Tax=Galerina marginata (strain CBS 339.88) TaxID=685588 RepID=A0A067T0Q4_GALM3|nr:hypothetical protein GALMADRAFT_252750 [Galerina marginata CBS 339.88]